MPCKNAALSESGPGFRCSSLSIPSLQKQWFDPVVLAWQRFRVHVCWQLCVPRLLSDEIDGELRELRGIGSLAMAEENDRTSDKTSDDRELFDLLSRSLGVR